MKLKTNLNQTVSSVGQYITLGSIHASSQYSTYLMVVAKILTYSRQYHQERRFLHFGCLASFNLVVW